MYYLALCFHSDQGNLGQPRVRNPQVWVTKGLLELRRPLPCPAQHAAVRNKSTRRGPLRARPEHEPGRRQEDPGETAISTSANNLNRTYDQTQHAKTR